MQAKFIFVTGGVVSGIGKGITTASIGLLLKNSGFSVDAIKFDPYLNIDPGTMSPFEHGEVYVLDDGSETDLDLGHYERFLNTNLNKNSSVTAGKIYDAILTKERKGEYLGKNVQLIPNVTNYIQDCFKKGLDSAESKQVRLIEIGGSTGDLEGEIFLESFRQFKQKYKQQILHIHLGYVPFLDCSGEYKTKPLQTSLRELLRSGLQPDILVARYHPEKNHKFSPNLLEKIALFGNLPEISVTALPDLDSIYEVPKYLATTNLISNLENFVGSKVNLELSDFWQKQGQVEKSKIKVKIGIVGKYSSKLGDSDYSLQQSLKIAGFDQNIEVEIQLLDAQKFENNPTKEQEEWDKLKSCQAIIIPGGFGNRGLEGKIVAINYARKNKIPFLGICLGLQMTVVEFGRNVCGLKAYSSEMLTPDNSSEGKDLVIDFMPDQKEIYKKGGTMRLGGYDCTLEKNTLASTLFGTTQIRERHRHRLEVQTKYLDVLEKNGLIVSGKHFFVDKDGKQEFLVEIVELSKSSHPYFIAIQSHPEFLSRPDKPHPLFVGLVKTAGDLATIATI